MTALLFVVIVSIISFPFQSSFAEQSMNESLGKSITPKLDLVVIINSDISSYDHYDDNISILLIGKYDGTFGRVRLSYSR